MMAWGMFVHSVATGEPVNAWLEAFDLDTRDGRGYVGFTTDASQAMRFDSIADILHTWKRQSAAVPLRPDGKPNRPLTAYSIEPRRLP